MTDSDIELDEYEKPKPQGGVPAWALILVIVAFLCLAATLTLQWLEYDYMRGTDLLGGPYAQAELLPSAN